MVAAIFITILLNWQTLDDYPLREHLDEAARFVGRAIAGEDGRTWKNAAG